MKIVQLPNLRQPRMQDIPEQLQDPTQWSAAAGDYGVEIVLRMIQTIPEVRERLAAFGARDSNCGPARMRGNWALAFIGFTMSGFSCIQPWWKQREHDHAYWKLFGFKHIPKYSTVHLRLTELEDDLNAFWEAAQTIIQRMRTVEPKIGAWVHVDATNTQTHAGLQHVCRYQSCPSSGRARVSGLDHAAASELREVAADNFSEGKDTLAEAEGYKELKVRRIEAYTALPAGVDAAKIGTGGRLYQLGNHWWYSRDAAAGTRAYVHGSHVKAWHGFLTQTAVDHYTQLPLGINVFAADQNEFQHYAELLAAVTAASGMQPLMVAADKGYSIREVFKTNTDKGIASVFPRKRKNQRDPLKSQGTKDFDIHGVPTCRHCQAPGNFVRFQLATKGNCTMPRLFFTCSLPEHRDCLGIQSISCAKDYRRLLPVWRTHPQYQAMTQQHNMYEFKHEQMRMNYRVGSNDARTRPRRIGLAWQTLRANCAMLIEWVRFAIRRPTLAPAHKSDSDKVGRRVAYRRLSEGLLGGGEVRSISLAARAAP
jgi:Transposase DDE domain